MKALRLLIFPFFCLIACSTEPVQGQRGTPDRDVCESRVAYERGRTDGRAGKMMSSKLASNCQDELRRPAQAAYQKGYQEGFASFRQRTAEDEARDFAGEPAAPPPPGSAIPPVVNAKTQNQTNN